MHLHLQEITHCTFKAASSYFSRTKTVVFEISHIYRK